MKALKFQITLLVIIVCICSCTSSKYTLQKQAPIQLTQTYLQHWTTGVAIGSSGVNLYFANLYPNHEGITLDSVYFRKMKGKLKPIKGQYFSRLTRMLSNKEGNALTTNGYFPFDLNNRECVISYTEEGTTKYYKVSNIKEKEGVYYPDGPPNN